MHVLFPKDTVNETFASSGAVDFPQDVNKLNLSINIFAKKAYWINPSILLGYNETVFHETFFEGG